MTNTWTHHDSYTVTQCIFTSFCHLTVYLCISTPLLKSKIRVSRKERVSLPGRLCWTSPSLFNVLIVFLVGTSGWGGGRVLCVCSLRRTFCLLCGRLVPSDNTWPTLDVCPSSSGLLSHCVFTGFYWDWVLGGDAGVFSVSWGQTGAEWGRLDTVRLHYNILQYSRCNSWLSPWKHTNHVTHLPEGTRRKG